MQNQTMFVNWLEGFLDGCGNTPNAKQMKEIRKRLSEVSNKADMVAMWPTSPISTSVGGSAEPYKVQYTPSSGTITLTQPLSQAFGKNPEANEEFLQAIEDSKNASTMEELLDA
jgi:hypothetical protein